jgi:hypothetical protein
MITPIPSAPRTLGVPAPERTVALAVAIGTATATPALVGDYPTLVRPRVERVQQGLGRLDQQLGVLRTAPVRMAEADWRAQTHSILDELAAANADLRALGARVGADGALGAEVQKLVGDVEFVVDEYRLAIDFDPDATHWARAGRAEKSTADEVESILAEFRRPIGRLPTPTPNR